MAEPLMCRKCGLRKPHAPKALCWVCIQSAGQYRSARKVMRAMKACVDYNPMFAEMMKRKLTELGAYNDG